MERTTFGRKPLNAQRPPSDRFVAPREQYTEIRRRVLWSYSRNICEIWCSKHLRREKYMSYLDKALDLPPLGAFVGDRGAQHHLPYWPCTPRERSCLSFADSVLDLPTYSHAAFPDLLDWGKDNNLVAALGSSYHLWSWRTQNLISQGYTQGTIHCCKFHPRGNLLLLGTSTTVEIHASDSTKLLYSRACICRDYKFDYCSITTLDWSPTGNSFVIGCSRGRITSMSLNSLEVLMSQKAARGAILVARVSPNARFMATAAVNGKHVQIFTWPLLKLYMRLNCSYWTVKTLCWHPWRSTLLGMGITSSDLEARVGLWAAASEQIREFDIGEKPYNLDSMLFSHRTGELVLSLWNSELSASPRQCSQLVVLSSPRAAVDQWGAALDRIRTMVFSPDGTKLATATADEDLIIWNFLPEKDAEKKSGPKRFHTIPVYLDRATHGHSVR